MDLTKEQIEALQKENEALKAKVTELDEAGGNANAARARRTLDDLKAKNEELTNKLAVYDKEKLEAEKAKLTEAERLKREAEEASSRAKKAEDALSLKEKEHAFKVAALKAGVTNVDDAAKLADLSGFDPSKPDDVTSFMDGFKKDKPYLFTAGKGPAQVGTSGGAPGPENGSQGHQKEQKIEEAKKTGDSLKVLTELSKK